MIGGIFIALALIFGPSAVSILGLIPLSILGVLLIYTGVQMVKLAADVKGKDNFIVVSTVVGLALVTSIAIAFMAGIILYYLLEAVEPMVKRVKAEDAVGKPLAHDVVHYGPKLKAVLFKRGHVVRAEDVEKLKNTGNYSVFVVEGVEKGVHEDDAALRMARASAGENLRHTRPNKGRVNLIAEKPGLLKVKADILKKVNLIDDFIFATQANNTGVKRGQVVGSVKIVPLMVEEDRMKEVEEVLEKNKPVLWVVSPKIKKIGAIITGREIYEGRVRDAFGPIIREKLGNYGLNVQETTVLPDAREKIKRKILGLKEGGYELILVAGGMAVDADDVTPAAIKDTGAEVVSYGVPTFPGSMLMVAYLDNVPILGLPACVIPDKLTSFDLILPRVLAKEKITREELAELGHGGLL